MSELLKTVPAGRSRGSGIREACPSQGEVKRGKRRFVIVQQSRGSKWEGKKRGKSVQDDEAKSFAQRKGEQKTNETFDTATTGEQKKKKGSRFALECVL